MLVDHNNYEPYNWLKSGNTKTSPKFDAQSSVKSSKAI